MNSLLVDWVDFHQYNQPNQQADRSLVSHQPNQPIKLSNSQTPNQEDFFPVAKTAEIQDGRITPITIHNTPIILTRIGQTIHAFSARCPHASGDLTQGDLHRGRIECPDHGYRFDIHSGFPVWPPDEVCRLKKYLTKEENGQLFVKI